MTGVQDAQIIQTLESVSKQVTDLLKAVRPAHRHQPVKLTVDIGNSLIEQSILVLASDRIPLGAIQAEADITVEMPQIKERFKTSWAAQYRLRCRSELRRLVDHVLAENDNDPMAVMKRSLNIEFKDQGLWKITIN